MFFFLAIYIEIYLQSFVSGGLICEISTLKDIFQTVWRKNPKISVKNQEFIRDSEANKKIWLSRKKPFVFAILSGQKLYIRQFF